MDLDLEGHAHAAPRPAVADKPPELEARDLHLRRQRAEGVRVERPDVHGRSDGRKGGFLARGEDHLRDAPGGVELVVLRGQERDPEVRLQRDDLYTSQIP